MTKYNVSVSHIDTCLPCYLQDHHNRPGELLLGVTVDGLSTYAQVKDELISEWNGADIYDVDGEDMESLESAVLAEIESEFAYVNNPDSLFDSSLDSPPSDDPDSDEYDSAVEGIEPSECGSNEAEIAQFRFDAMRDAQREWEQNEMCFAWFLVTYEADDSEES